MTTNANGDDSLTPEYASDSRSLETQDDDWEGLKRAHNKAANPNKSENSSADSVDKAFTGLGIFWFIVCWIVFGVIIFNVLMGMGIFVVFAVLGGVIGGFISAVVVFIMGMAGITL